MHVHVAPDIAAAVTTSEGALPPVVALESALITHGLPFPHNLEVAQELEATVRAAGAIPATIGVREGVLVVGLDDAELEELARHEHPAKISRRDLPAAVAQRRTGGTTVAATMAITWAAGIHILATGGIGGVHHGTEPHARSWDVSADVQELAQTPVLVICAGAKAILDLPATLEQLETLGVPLVGYETDELPAFYSRESGLPLPVRADTPAEIAQIWQAQNEPSLDKFFYSPAPRGGMLVCVPPPADVALPRSTIEAALTDALAKAAAQQVRGPAVTPFLLNAIADATNGASIMTNRALLRQNAHLAARIATSRK